LYFESYEDFCTKEFSFSFEVSLLLRVVLNAACTELEIRNAVMAIGALSRSQNSAHEFHEQPYPHEYPLKQYNSAIMELNQQLDGSARSWELAILGAILFTAIEAMQGHDRTQMHVRSAFAILKTLPRTTRTSSLYRPAIEETSVASGTKQSNFLADSDLVALFSVFCRLDPQASSFSALDSLTYAKEPIYHQNFQGSTKLANASAQLSAQCTPSLAIAHWEPKLSPTRQYRFH
jgi:hypothetical protein